MGSTRSTAGSANAARSPRDVTRESRTATLMENIMTGGEVSKKREAELQKAANYGRGVQFVQASPTVKGLTQKDGKAVMRTGVTPSDYTGRITANAPTLRELGGDITRALVGGQAPDPGYTGEFSKYTPKPQPVKGLIPTVMDAAIRGRFSPITAAITVGSNFFSYGDNNNDSKPTETRNTMADTFKASQEASREKTKKILASQRAAELAKKRSLLGTSGDQTFGGKD